VRQEWEERKEERGDDRILHSSKKFHRRSVYVRTSDLTANAGEDYVQYNSRLLWMAESAEAKTVKLMILSNEGVSEGEER